uniref:Uncharacterized protein n=1 Tax=Anopheles arabiensis TaxID=7173 RepID=A0A182HQN9_ANOAR
MYIRANIGIISSLACYRTHCHQRYHTLNCEKMIKFLCLFAFLAASCLALPVEDHPKLSRPSPINPDVASDPKPTELKELSPASSSTTESHIQKVPATGVKLSIEVAKNEATTSTSPSTDTEQTTKNNPKRSVESDSSASTTTAANHPAFRRNQPSTTTEQPSSTTGSSSTSSPVSVKTPIATTTSRTKREVAVTAATASSSAGTTAAKRTTTVAPATSSDDKEGPHFVRPVPVDQILKNFNLSEKSTGSAATVQQPKPEQSKDEQKSDESFEEASEHRKEESEQKTHQQTHPVIRQQGA